MTDTIAIQEASDLEHSGPTPPFDYLRVSVTEQCQLHCAYCRPAGIPQPRPHEPLPLTQLVACCAAICAAAPIRKIRLSGGEPLLRPDLPELVEALVALPGQPEVVLTTNGVLLADHAQPLAAAGLSRLNVSLDSGDPACYRQATGSDAFGRVLSGLEAAREAGFRDMKLNVVLMSSLDPGEIGRLLQVAADHQAMLRLIELMPLGLPQEAYRQMYLSASAALARVSAALGEPPTPLEVGASGAQHPRYLAPLSDGRAVTVEMISPMSRPFCGECRRIRLTSQGQLLPCLLSSERVPLLGEDGAVPPADEVRRRLLRCARLKCRAATPPAESMWAIGG